MKLRVFAVCAVLLQCLPGIAGANFLSEGESLFVRRGCVRCHTVGRGRFVGPDLKGVFDRHSREKVVLWITDPSSVYRESGKVPVNEGYPPMPQTGVGSDEAEKIADYLLSIQNISPVLSGGGTVSGKVVNRTANAPAEGVEVTLGSFVGDRQISSRPEKTGAEGNFSFDGLEWTAAHRISIVHEGVFYETAKMVFKPEQSRIEVSLPIYETRVDDSAIGIELNHLIVEPSLEGVRVAEFVEFANRGNTAVVSDEKNGNSATLRFGVPGEAADVNFVHNADSRQIRERDGRFGYGPVLPGLKRVVFAYRIPFKSGISGGSRAVFEKTLEYDTSSFVVISPQSEGIEVGGLGEGRPVSGRDGRVFWRWDGAGLDKGDKVRVFVRLPGGKRPEWVLPALVLGVVLAIAAAYGMFGRREGKES